MGAPKPPPLPPPPPIPSGELADPTELARQRDAIQRRRRGRSTLVIDPGIAAPSPAGDGLFIGNK